MGVSFNAKVNLHKFGQFNFLRLKMKIKQRLTTI